MEVIARKKNAAKAVYAIMFALGLVMIVLGIVAFFLLGDAGIVTFVIGVVFGVACWGGCIFFMVKVRKLNDVLVSFDGTTLFFPGSSCQLGELYEAKCIVSGKKDAGTLILNVAGKNQEFYNVADVNRACARLNYIIGWYRSAVASPAYTPAAPVMTPQEPNRTPRK